MSKLVVNEHVAAERLGLSVRTLQRWRVTGQGPTFRKLGKRVGYTAGDLEAFLERAARSSTSDAGPAAA